MNLAEQIVSYSFNASQYKNAVSVTEFENFCKEFLFEQIKGNNFGYAFCKKFNIEDIFLKKITSEVFAKERIKQCEYVNYEKEVC